MWWRDKRNHNTRIRQASQKGYNPSNRFWKWDPVKCTGNGNRLQEAELLELGDYLNVGVRETEEWMRTLLFLTQMTRKDGILLYFCDRKPRRTFLSLFCKTLSFDFSYSGVKVSYWIAMTIYKLLKILTLILEMSELLFEARVESKITKTEGRMRGKTENWRKVSTMQD